MSKILMSHGTMFDVANPDPELVNLDEIAHHLDHKCRFGGGTSQFYSVAEHSIIGALMIYEQALPFLNDIDNTGRLNIAKCFLLHDAAEAYIGDIPTPVKKLIGNRVFEIERNISLAIFKKLWPEWFDFSIMYQDAIQYMVNRVDQAMLAIERNIFMPEHEEWVLLYPEIKQGTRTAEWLTYQLTGFNWQPGEGVDTFKRFYRELFVEGKLQLN